MRARPYRRRTARPGNKADLRAFVEPLILARAMRGYSARKCGNRLNLSQLDQFMVNFLAAMGGTKWISSI
jgi:hypothetical protein